MTWFMHFMAGSCGVWSITVFVVQCIGVLKLFVNYSTPPPKATSESLPDAEVPHVTIIRPVKGLEPQLYECLASTFQQTYPRHKLSVHICVSSKDDPAYPVLQRVIADFPGFDSRLYVETEDPLLHGQEGNANNLGPNPKIRNISRAYREAKGDVMWIVDCNVWVGRGVAGRMVDKLFGFLPHGRRATPFKFVHQLPIVVDVSDPSPSTALMASALARGGGRLDEMFMATTHAKFYSAINTVGIAPCVVGKSNMFRRSHLDAITDPAQNPILSCFDAAHGRRGIDFFSAYICEDHLIGDLLWKSQVPSPPGAAATSYNNHGLVPGDIAVQPMANMSVAAYVARRVRWLRARKWTVILATLVEPGVESLLCCTYFAFFATALPSVRAFLRLDAYSSRVVAFGLCWVCAVMAWIVVDRLTYLKLHACDSVDVDEHTPEFARGWARREPGSKRGFGEWLLAWLGREVLALPVWTWAVLLGTTVDWRGKTFRVTTDMSVVEIGERTNKLENGATWKSRTE